MCIKTPNFALVTLFFFCKIRKSAVGSQAYLDAQKKLSDEVAHRERVDHTIGRIAKLLFGHENSSKMSNVRSPGQPLVDDWDCLKTHVKFAFITINNLYYQKKTLHLLFF